MFVIHGAVKRGVWCEVHSLPHILEYAVYSYCEATPGHLSIRHLKDVSRCDMR